MLHELFKILCGLLVNNYIFNSSFNKVDKDVNGNIISYDDKLIISNHVISMFNCVPITFLCLSDIFFDYDLYINVIKYQSIGFLIYDMYLINNYKPLSDQKWIYTLHHIMFISTWYNYYGYKHIYLKLLLSEMSVIAINLKVFSRYYFPNKSKLLFFMIWFTFLITRIIGGTHTLITNFNVVTKFPLITTTYITLQYYWFTLMTLKGYKMYNQLKQM